MALDLQGIEGLTPLEVGSTPRNLAGHRFALPHNFPASKLASRWVEDGPEVAEARQDQVLAFANVRARGWQVWENPDAEKGSKDKYVRRVVGKKTFILMFRPKELQNAVGRIYAAESRSFTNAELRGETNRVNDNNDPGILTNQDLRTFSREDHQTETLPPVPINRSPEEAATINLKT